MFYTLIDDQAEFVVVHKFPGVVVQGERDGETLLNFVREGMGLAELYPVHRLDKETSGVVVFAKTKAANQALSQAFADKKVKKIYLALSDRKPIKKQGLIRGDMVKARGGSYRLTRSLENPAETRFNSCSLAPSQRLFILTPFSGKTHQLRVALKSLSAPIIGDKRYGGTGADRMYLHAYALSFPVNGVSYSYQALPATGILFDCAALEPLLKRNSLFSEIN